MKPARVIIAGLLFAAVGTGVSLVAVSRPAQTAAPALRPIEPKVAFAARPFPLQAVRLLDGPFRDAMLRDQKYLLALDPDRLLHNFRVTAGLPSTAKPLGGWEAPDVELRGHSVGHYLSALAEMYASTGDERFKARGDLMVAELAKVQAAMPSKGYREGYLSAFPEEFIDRVDARQKVWAPYYTLHKIMAGLLDVYEQCGDRRALDVLEGMARWVKSRTDKSDAGHMERVLNATEQGGMNEVLANLHTVTGKPEYLALARRFDERHYVEPLARFEDNLTGEHANSFIPNVIGAAREHEITGDPVLANVATFFWRQSAGARSFATGGVSDGEGFEEPPFRMEAELGRESHETCCTYNLLKLTRHLFGWSADAAYADYYERALWNGILSTQDPADGMVMYYVATRPGMYRTFMAPEDSFWCCTGTGMENHVKSGDSIYFHDADGAFVNLFVASELDWAEKGFRLRQETRFPEEAATRLTILAAPAAPVALRIRVPGWIAPGGKVRLNGRTLEEFASPSSYLSIRRAWKAGDRVEVDLPMSLRMERLPDNPAKFALLYGPIVLAGKLGGAEALTKDKVSGKYGPEGDPVAVPKIAVSSPNPSKWLKAVPGQPLTFRTDGAGKPADVTLVPFYKLFGERYAIYWEMEGAAKTRPGPR